MPAIEVATGVRIGYEEAGEGYPVVLIPATAVDHTIFMPGNQFSTLSAQFRVVAIDNRGTGGSTRPDEDYGIGDLAEDVIAVMSALGIERAHLLGLSMGSLVAQLAAAHHPERVSGLVLYNTWAYTDEFLRRQFDIWRHLYATADPAFYGASTLWWVLSREFIAAQPEVLDAIARDAFVGPSAPSRSDVLRHVDIDLHHDARALLPRIAAPSLLIGGEYDRVIFPRYVREVATLIPGARLEMFAGPGSSHGLFLERAEEVNRLTGQFLGSLQ